jgi:hypothetical protein
MMVYNTQNYWVFGLCSSSGIVETRKHNIWETRRTELKLALSKGPKRVGVSPLHLRMETDPVSETLFSIF